MKNGILLNATALLSVLCLIVALIVPAGEMLDLTVDVRKATVIVTGKSLEIAAAEPDDSIALVKETNTQVGQLTKEELNCRLSLILSLNFCYGDTFFNRSDMVRCAALSLADYAADLPGVGLAVNACLIEGFIKSFYGLDLSAEEQAVDGFVAVPVTDCSTRFFEISSIIEADDGFEVIAKELTYFGGDGYGDETVRAIVKLDAESEFGFNLVFAELL